MPSPAMDHSTRRDLRRSTAIVDPRPLVYRTVLGLIVQTDLIRAPEQTYMHALSLRMFPLAYISLFASITSRPRYRGYTRGTVYLDGCGRRTHFLHLSM